MEQRIFAGSAVASTEANGRTWIRVYDLVRNMDLNLTKEQVDVKLAGTTTATQIDGKWFVTMPRGVKLLLAKCRPYTEKGKAYKRLAMEEARPGLNMVRIPDARKPEPAAKEQAGTGTTITDLPKDTATVMGTLQEQLVFANARIKELTEMLADQMRAETAPRPMTAVPPRSLRDTIRLHVASYATKLIYANGLTRNDPRIRDWYERVWANLYSEFAARTGVDFRRRFNNLTEEERRRLSVSSVVDYMARWLPVDGLISKGGLAPDLPADSVGVLPEFHAMVCELCPVARFQAWERMPVTIRHSFYDGTPTPAPDGKTADAGEQKAF